MQYNLALNFIGGFLTMWIVEGQGKEKIFEIFAS